MKNSSQGIKGIKGILPLQLREGKYFHVFGGPYANRPEYTFGVKLAKEIKLPADVEIPSVDFGVPDMEDMVQGVEEAVKAICKGFHVYAGCMGGIGRTGTFLACLAKTFGEGDPVKYVRGTYLPHAVETGRQIQLIEDFYPSKKTLAIIRWARIRSHVFLQVGLRNKPISML